MLNKKDLINIFIIKANKYNLMHMLIYTIYF